jgi:hypothetical protein
MKKAADHIWSAALVFEVEDNGLEPGNENTEFSHDETISDAHTMHWEELRHHIERCLDLPVETRHRIIARGNSAVASITS